jgi:hypothetical protein
MSGGGDIPQGKRRGCRLLLVLSALICFLLSVPLCSQTLIPASETETTGTLGNLHADQRVVQNGRWLIVREFNIDFAVKNAAVFCGELTTTNATEAHDLIDSKGQPVQFVENGKDLFLTLKSGRKIHARRLSSEKCPRA